MSNTGLVAAWKRRLARAASIGEYIELTSDPFASSFGVIGVGARGDEWPTHKGQPMWPLLQINCADLPHRPASIADLALIRVWVSPEFFDEPAENGKGWCVRASRTLEGLERIQPPEHGSEIEQAGVAWRLHEADYPTWDDAPEDLPEELQDDYHDLFEAAIGLKVGGWPHTVQSEIYWAPWKKHPASPEYVFQIDSEPDLNWMWGDSGFGYFGRGTGAHRDAWAFEWQCY